MCTKLVQLPCTKEVQQLPVTLKTTTVAVLIKPLLTNTHGITLNQIQTCTTLINIFATSFSTNCPGDCSSGAATTSIAFNGSLAMINLPYKPFSVSVVDKFALQTILSKC